MAKLHGSVGCHTCDPGNFAFQCKSLQAKPKKPQVTTAKGSENHKQNFQTTKNHDQTTLAGNTVDFSSILVYSGALTSATARQAPTGGKVVALGCAQGPVRDPEDHKAVIARLPGCAGHAVSAYTQVKMEDTAGLLKLPKSVCPDFWIRLHRHKWPKSWSNIEDPWVSLERSLYGHPHAGLCEMTTLKSSIGTWTGKSTELGMPVRASEARSIPICTRG